jgi:hypothetical protein
MANLINSNDDDRAHPRFNAAEPVIAKPRVAFLGFLVSATVSGCLWIMLHMERSSTGWRAAFYVLLATLAVCGWLLGALINLYTRRKK